MPPLIQLQDVGKSFTTRGGGIVQAMGPINLEIGRQEFITLVGPSGCGKSTVLNLIAGLMEPTSGRVTYDGKSLSGPNQRVGYMTQKDTLLPWRTVADNIGLSLELRRRAVSKKERCDRIAQIIDLVGLKGFDKHYPAELSGGMRKRVALARMLIYEPETLLLDEPFGALDAQLKIVMHQELLRLVQAREMTTIFVTHDLSEAITLADRVTVFTSRPGRIRAIRQVPLARPRDVMRTHFSTDFATIYEDLWSELRDEVALGTET
jgi:NitT/TauT family transport system ATP-binding protein